jgi:hypothetical protein
MLMTGRDQDDNATAYGTDQDREGTSTAPGEGPAAADRNPDDFGPEAVGGTDVNPDTGMERGAVDNSSAGR